MQMTLFRAFALASNRQRSRVSVGCCSVVDDRLQIESLCVLFLLILQAYLSSSVPGDDKPLDFASDLLLGLLLIAIVLAVFVLFAVHAFIFFRKVIRTYQRKSTLEEFEV